MDERSAPISRRDLVKGAAASAALCGAPLAAASAYTIPGVPPYAVYDPLFESVRVALWARGSRYAPDYIQGISGAGFRIGGPCPCAPTCVACMTQPDLIRMLGYEVEVLGFDAGPKDLKTQLAELLPRVKAEIRAGRPVIVFHAFTSAEWDVVCGYDGATGVFRGRGAYDTMRGEEYASADQGRMITCTDICPVGGVLAIGKKVGRLDTRKAEADALRSAVRHARDTSQTGYPFEGLAVYDKWLGEWAKTDAKPDWLRDGYTTATYSSTHHAGAQFLRRLKRGYPGAVTPLQEAANHLDAEAGALHKMLAVLFPGPGKPSPEGEPVRRSVRKLLASARGDYEAMADAVERAVAAIAG